MVSPTPRELRYARRTATQAVQALKAPSGRHAPPASAPPPTPGIGILDMPPDVLDMIIKSRRQSGVPILNPVDLARFSLAARPFRAVVKEHNKTDEDHAISVVNRYLRDEGQLRPMGGFLKDIENPVIRKVAVDRISEYFLKIVDETVAKVSELREERMRQGTFNLDAFKTDILPIQSTPSLIIGRLLSTLSVIEPALFTGPVTPATLTPVSRLARAYLRIIKGRLFIRSRVASRLSELLKAIAAARPKPKEITVDLLAETGGHAGLDNDEPNDFIDKTFTVVRTTTVGGGGRRRRRRPATAPVKRRA